MKIERFVYSVTSFNNNKAEVLQQHLSYHQMLFILYIIIYQRKAAKTKLLSANICWQGLKCQKLLPLINADYLKVGDGEPCAGQFKLNSVICWTWKVPRFFIELEGNLGAEEPTGSRSQEKNVENSKTDHNKAVYWATWAEEYLLVHI